MPDSTILRGVPFAKMTGSGNDFVFFDGRLVDSSRLTSPQVIQAICNRYNGIGADGIVILEPLDRALPGEEDRGDARIHYFNSDGSPADLCGNATLCSTTMAVEMEIGNASGMLLATPSGLIACKKTGDRPEIELRPISNWRSDIAITLVDGEQRVGFAEAGIPHVVLLSTNVDQVHVADRGPTLRWHPEAGPKGANVNWVSPRSDGTWRYRTFERGVEGETLACGTGAVAAAILLKEWGLADSTVTLKTSSGRDLEIRMTSTDTGVLPSLKGEGRVVFRGVISDLEGTIRG